MTVVAKTIEIPLKSARATGKKNKEKGKNSGAVGGTARRHHNSNYSRGRWKEVNGGLKKFMSIVAFITLIRYRTTSHP